MPQPLANGNVGERFIDKIAPGGKYYKYALGTLIGFGGILIVLVLFLTVPQIRNLIFKPTPTATPTSNIPRPSPRPLPRGFQSWQFSYGNGATGPQIKTATVDTLIPPLGSSQTVNVELTNNSPVTQVTAVVYTDNKTATYQMSLTKGDANNGNWTGIWKLDDTTDYRYHIDFFFQSPGGGSQSALTFR